MRRGPLAVSRVSRGIKHVRVAGMTTEREAGGAGESVPCSEQNGSGASEQNSERLEASRSLKRQLAC